ncbi:MAG: prenyltransferase, partial [Pseudomonadota bacterium]
MTADTPSVGHNRTGFWFGPWIQAARPIAFPMIFVPLLIGQATAFRYGNTFEWVLLGYSIAFGALYQTYLLYTNDHADEAIDKTNHQYWLSGGSRVLPDGKLTGSQLLAGARVAFGVLLIFTGYLAVFADRPLMLIALGLAVALCWAYNRPPLQWSYRGHGEALQGLGCGVLLPLIGYYLQLGTVAGYPWVTLIPLFLI